ESLNPPPPPPRAISVAPPRSRDLFAGRGEGGGGAGSRLGRLPREAAVRFCSGWTFFDESLRGNDSVLRISWFDVWHPTTRAAVARTTMKVVGMRIIILTSLNS